MPPLPLLIAAANLALLFLASLLLLRSLPLPLRLRSCALAVSHCPRGSLLVRLLSLSIFPSLGSLPSDLLAQTVCPWRSPPPSEQQ